MNLRTLSISVAVLAALSAVVWFLQRPAAPVSTDPRVGQALLDADIASRVARIRLADQDRNVELTRQPDASWRVTSYHDLPADFPKLSRLISDLTEAKIQRLVTSRPDRIARLEFKNTTIALLDDAGKELWHLTLGKHADGGGRFVRFGTEEKGYQAGLSVWLDPEGKSWADATLLNLKADDIAGVELSFADHAAFTASRAKKEDAWTSARTPPDKQVKADRISSLLSSVGSLRFTDTTDPGDANVTAARAHSRTIKLTTFDQKTYTIVLGRKPEDKKPKAASPGAKPQDDGGPDSIAAEAAATAASGSGTSQPAGDSASDGPAPAEAEKPKEPEFETIPAGPVYAFITSSDEKAAINELMKKRAFQIGEWTFTGLPASPEELWEDAPKPPLAPPADKPADSGH